MEFPRITPPDQQVRREAVARHPQLTKPAGSLGRLEKLGVWASACQGICPPHPFVRPQVVVFAGDHGIAAYGVSAYPSEVTQQMVSNFLSGGAAVNALAAAAGAAVRVIDLAVDCDPAAVAGSPLVTRHKIRRGSGPIHQQDALTDAEVTQALEAGITIANEEVDRGADLLIAGDMGIGNTTPAAVLVAALTEEEPVAVVGRGSGIDDAGWMRKAAAIRDALRRALPVADDPIALVRTAGGADIAAMATFLAQAAVRRTPVILDGLVVGAAAMLAEELAPGARRWWVAGHRSVEPAHTMALDHLELEPILDLGMRLGEGSGAVAALPLVQMAVRVLGEMATFADAGVSGPAGAPSPLVALHGRPTPGLACPGRATHQVSRGLRLAVSWLTVLPVGAPLEVDRTIARQALYWAPLVGAGLGLLAAGLLTALHMLGTPSLLTGLAAVAVLAGLTRGMHLDGLADTADGLGCYGGPQRALDVMRDGATGPCGVVTLVLVLSAQAAALGALAETGRLIPVVLAMVAGRAAFGWCARLGVPPARPAGLGALVAGSQPPAVPMVWSVVLLAGGLVAVPGRPWQGPLAVGLAALAVLALSAHTCRRFGGLTGDVLGATSELITTVILAVCAV